MKPFKSLSPDTEIRGQLMLAFIYCTESDHIRPFLEKHGLSDIQPNQWYLEQPWLDMLNDLTSTGAGAMFDFVSIGMKMADLMPLPAEAKSLSLEDAMIAWAA